jgi:peptide/nickel transport system permease protein
MLRFLLRRLLLMALTLGVISVTIFGVTEVLPGDVAQAMLGQEATPESLAVVRAQLGLDRPAPVRFATWIAGALHGDLGASLRLGVPVAPLLAQRLGK